MNHHLSVQFRLWLPHCCCKEGDTGATDGVWNSWLKARERKKKRHTVPILSCNTASALGLLLVENVIRSSPFNGKGKKLKKKERKKSDRGE